jgi:toxin-antitoxin system PIN domain toxin
MKLVDTNVWLALALSKHVHHAAAQAWLASESNPNQVLLCRATQQSVLRLLTTAAVVKPYGLQPLSNADAWDLVERFLADPRVGMALEPAGLEAHWKALAARTTSSPKLWMDGFLASFAIAGGYQLVTTDQGFTQFAGLNVLVLAP